MKKLIILLAALVLSGELYAKEYLLTGARPDKLFVIDAEDGRIAKTLTVPGQNMGSWSIVPSIGDHRVYVTSYNHQRILGLSLMSGAVEFQADLGLVGERVRAFYGLDVSADGTRLYAHVNPVKLLPDRYQVLDNRVLEFDTAAGLNAKPLRTFPVPRRIQGLMLSSDNRSLYLLGRDYLQMDLATGDLTETHAIGNWTIPSRTPGDVGGHWVSFEHSDTQTQVVYSVHADRDPYSLEAYQTGIVQLNRRTGAFEHFDFENTTDFIFATAASPKKPDVFGVYNTLVKIDSAAHRTVKRVPLEATYYTVNTSVNGERVFIGGGGCKVAAHRAGDLKRIWGRELPGCADQSFSWLRVVDIDLSVLASAEPVTALEPISKRVLLAQYQDAWNRHDVATICDYFADDLVFEDIPMGLHANSKAAFAQILRKTFKEVPDFSMTIDQVLEGRDFVVTQWRQRGTATGELESASVASKPYEVKTTSVIEFSGNKIKRLSDNWDASVFYKK
jgi:quinohemoprotein amine dehydrogenase beta subunit